MEWSVFVKRWYLVPNRLVGPGLLDLDTTLIGRSTKDHEKMATPHIITVGQSPIGKFESTGRELFSEAISDAFQDLPAPRELVEALYVGNQSESYEHQIMYGSQLAEWAGLRHIPAERVEGCAASGGLALKNAVQDVQSGTHDVVLAAGVEKMSSGGTGVATDALMAASERMFEQRSGITAHGLYAMLAQRYLYETDATEEDLAKIAVKNHHNATKNPNAQFDKEIDVETVLESDYVANPLKFYDCAPVSDGAAVVLVANEDVASDFVSQDDQITVDGYSAVADNLALAEHNLTDLEGANKAIKSVYNQANLSAADIDVAEVHDAFTVNEALLAEAAGFTPAEKGTEIALDPSERSDGCTNVQVSTSGGLKARGHPIGATGLLQAIEAYEQLTSKANQERQVPDSTAALIVNEGGTADAITTAHILTA